MAYDRMFTRLTWGGRIGQLTEHDIWSCGVNIALTGSTDGPGLPTAGELQTLLDGALSTFHASTALQLSAGAVLLWAKAASIDPDGEYTAAPVTAETTGVLGASTSGTDGPQSSLVVTLYSGSTFGLANYGRFYLPWCMLPVARTDGRISPTDVNGAAGVAETFLNALNAWAGVSLSPTARLHNLSSKGSGASKLVVRYRVGDVKDTQRRRRNRIDEHYASGPVTV